MKEDEIFSSSAGNLATILIEFSESIIGDNRGNATILNGIAVNANEIRFDRSVEIRSMSYIVIDLLTFALQANIREHVAYFARFVLRREKMLRIYFCCASCGCFLAVVLNLHED